MSAAEPRSAIDSEATADRATGARAADPDETTVIPHEVPVHGSRRSRGGSIALSVLVAIGVFALVLAWMLPKFVAPRMVELPANPDDGQNLIATGASVLVPDLKSPTGVDLLNDATVTSDTWVSGAPGGDFGPDNVVWLMATETSVAGHGLLNARVERVSLNRHTGKPNNCCGDAIITDQSHPAGQPVVHIGAVSGFPFNLKRQDYPLWNSALTKPVTAHYTGQTHSQGMNLYEYRSVVPLVNTGTADLPGSLFGSKAASVKAIAQYADDRQMKVEPESGTPVDVIEHTTQQYTYNGHTVKALDAELILGPPTAKHLKLYQDANKYLPWLHGRISVVLVLVASALFTAAALLGRRRRDERQSVED